MIVPLCASSFRSGLGSSARASASVAWDVERLGKATSSINLFGAIRNMDGPDADK